MNKYEDNVDWDLEFEDYVYGLLQAGKEKGVKQALRRLRNPRTAWHADHLLSNVLSQHGDKLSAGMLKRIRKAKDIVAYTTYQRDNDEPGIEISKTLDFDRLRCQAGAELSRRGYKMRPKWSIDGVALSAFMACFVAIPVYLAFPDHVGLGIVILVPLVLISFCLGCMYTYFVVGTVLWDDSEYDFPWPLMDFRSRWMFWIVLLIGFCAIVLVPLPFAHATIVCRWIGLAGILAFDTWFYLFWGRCAHYEGDNRLFSLFRRLWW